MDRMISILLRMEKLIKLVSTRMWYGGPSWVLYWKKRAETACSTCLGFASFCFWRREDLDFSEFDLTRVSLGEIIFLVTANFLVFFAFPILCLLVFDV